MHQWQWCMECTLRYCIAGKFRTNMEKTDTSARMMNHRDSLMYILKLLGVAALYALLAKIVLTFFSANGVVSIVWPPSGLALAVLLIGGKRYFPGVFLGALLANAMTGLTLGVAASIAMGNTLEALLGIWLLTRNGRFNSNMGTLHDYLRLVALGGFVACSVAALNGSTTLLASGFITTEIYFQNLLNWWMGDALGIILLTPLILVWQRMPDRWLEPTRAAEAILLLSLMFLSNQIVFLGWFHDTSGIFEQVARGYWMFLLVALIGVRLGTRGVLIALVMTAIQALFGAALGVGFFAGDIAKTGLINYWFYIVVLSVVGMALATYFAEREQMERALRRSEEGLNRAQAVSQTGSWFLDIPTSRLEWSAETYRMFGIPQQQTVDLATFVAITHPDDRDFVLNAWGEAMAGAPYDIEHRIMAGGRERWVRERARIERNAEGRPLTGIGTVQDITERKQLEMAQRESEKLYRSLFENMLNGFAYCQMIFEQDQPHDFIYLSVNAAFETLTGLKNVVGKRVSEVVPDIQQTDAKLFELYGRVSLSGKPERFEIYLEALQQWFWISVYSPEKGYFAVTFDVITERKQAEEKLRASEQKFMRLFMEIPIPLGVANKDGVIAYFNNKFTEVFGYTTSDVPTLNEWWLKAYPDETYRRWVMDNWNDAVAKAAKEGANVESAEYRVTCKNGAGRIVIIGGSPVEGGVLAIFNDITERKAAEQALQQSKDRLALALKGSSDAPWDWDIERDQMYYSPQWWHMLGYAVDELPNDAGLWLRLEHPDDIATTGQALTDALQNAQESFAVESRLRHKDGHYVSVLTRGFIMRNESGKPLRATGTNMDLTERKQSEEALRESENRYRLLVESSPFCIHEIDLEGRLLSMNRAGLNMLGLDDARKICGMQYLSMVSLQDAGRVGALLRDAITNGIPSYFEFSAAGDVPLYFKSCFIPIKDASGKVLKLMGITEDITEREQAEKELREKTQLLDSIVENIPNMIFLKRASDLRFALFNRAGEALVGHSRDELLGRNDYDFFPKEQADFFTGKDRATLEQDGIVDIAEEPIETPHGTRILHTRKLALRDEQGQPQYLLGISEDITERKEHEEELKRSNADLEQFSYAVSHDMRQPLRVISSYLQLLEMGLADQLDGEKRNYFNFAIEGAKRIDQMLVELLEYSRVGRMGEPPAWIESRAALDEALQFLQPALIEAQAKLNIAGDWPRILTSHDEILRLLQNLIGNAAKFRVAGRTPEITVTSEVVQNEWRLCIADNGVGIIPDQIKRLFQVFQRLQSREAYEGTGIGLALCRKIAEHHKGRIWVESAGEGQGSKFYVVLPVSQMKTTLQ